MRKTHPRTSAAGRLPGRLLPILWMLLLLGLACGPTQPNAEDASEAASRPRPQRIVSLTPSITEILFELGLAERVVGVTQFCDWPPEAADKPRVGGYSNPSIESVLAQRPDLVLVSPNTGNREAALAIERAGVRLEVIEGDSLEETYQAVQQVADAAGVPEEGVRLAAEIRHRIDEARRRVAGRDAVPTLFSVQLEPMIAAGSDTLISELVEAAGGRNVVQAEGYPRLGIETVLQSGPEVVFQTRMGMQAEEERALTDAFWQRWPAIPAVRDGRVTLIDASIATRPGPRIADAVDQLARRLHPEAFETP